ncbi:hypothetical protein V8B97DRAFT_2070319 [Scleroderma yunnanense]
MESLDLNGLAKSLPASNFEKAEKDLLNNFKAAALSITTLYRSSRNASKRAYNVGYAAACQDLMSMIQQGVSVGASHNGEALSIGRILDWIEARIEAIKAREEEEDEDEEREKEKERARAGPPANPTAPVSFPSKASASEHTTAPLTPHSPALTNPSIPHPHPHPPPSPSPTITARSASFPNTRPIKGRIPFSRKDLSDPSSTSTLSHPIPFSSSENIFRSPGIPITPIPISIPLSGTGTGTGNTDDSNNITAGAKRRHTVMMMLDNSVEAPSTAIVDVASSSPPGGPGTGISGVSPHVGALGNVGSGTTRRRTRSGRSAHHHHHHQSVQSGQPDSMDVEEDGRERKRVARR